MSGERGDVLKTEVAARGIDVTVDLSGDGIGDKTAEHYTPPGVDALPLPGDEVIVEEADGQGHGTACGYQDPKNQGKAAPGEIRLYARSPDGSWVAEVWLRSDGSVTIRNSSAKMVLLADGSLDYNDGAFRCDVDGNGKFKGEVTAKADSPAAVVLTTHVHPTAMGPSGPPKPGP